MFEQLQHIKKNGKSNGKVNGRKNVIRNKAEKSDFALLFTLILLFKIILNISSSFFSVSVLQMSASIMFTSIWLHNFYYCIVTLPKSWVFVTDPVVSAPNWCSGFEQKKKKKTKKKASLSDCLQSFDSKCVVSEPVGSCVCENWHYLVTTTSDRNNSQRLAQGCLPRAVSHLEIHWTNESIGPTLSRGQRLLSVTEV